MQLDGGPPAMTVSVSAEHDKNVLAEKKFDIPFHRPSLGEDEVRAVADVVRSGWLTTGSKCIEFEEKFAHKIGVKHALAVSSCTAALHLALEALGIGAGDEVLIPTLTFAATAEVVTYLKAKPVLVDSEPSFLQIDMLDAEKKITRRTRAIVPVHFAGACADMSSVIELATAHKLSVVEDAAHAFPASYQGRMVGTISPITAFSFYATKTITTGEGGMAVTNCDDLASRMRTMRLHGMSRDAWKRFAAGGTWRYEILDAGFKYNLTDLQAALGIVQLARAEVLREKREAVVTRYTERLAGSDALTLPSVPPNQTHAWHLYVIRLNTEVIRVSRDQIINELSERGIGTAVHFIPLHYHPYYQSRWNYQIGDFPMAERYFERCISLPLFPDMTVDEIDYVVDQVLAITARYRR
jgi:dTDP-4-amino-4,6-dideoxygalactose transaminase